MVNYTYDRRTARGVPSTALHEVAKNLDEQFGNLVRSGDAAGLVREEAKMVREFKAGVHVLRDRLDTLKQATKYGPSLPDAVMGLVWNSSQKEGSLAVQTAIRSYEDAIQTATLAAIAAEQWFGEKIQGINPNQVLFNWPTF